MSFDTVFTSIIPKDTVDKIISNRELWCVVYAVKKSDYKSQHTLYINLDSMEYTKDSYFYLGGFQDLKKLVIEYLSNPEFNVTKVRIRFVYDALSTEEDYVKQLLSDLDIKELLIRN